jgi:hypothetical protein
MRADSHGTAVPHLSSLIAFERRFSTDLGFVEHPSARSAASAAASDVGNRLADRRAAPDASTSPPVTAEDVKRDQARGGSMTLATYLNNVLECEIRETQNVSPIEIDSRGLPASSEETIDVRDADFHGYSPSTALRRRSAVGEYIAFPAASRATQNANSSTVAERLATYTHNAPVNGASNCSEGMSSAVAGSSRADLGSEIAVQRRRTANALQIFGSASDHPKSSARGDATPVRVCYSAWYYSFSLFGN